MKKIILIIAVFVALAGAVDFSADTVVSPELRKLIDAVPVHSQFPNASYYIITDSTVVRQTSSGWTKEVYFLAKAYTYRGKNRLSNYKIFYNADYQDVEVLRARTINEDGVSPADSTEINDITAPGYSEATKYGKFTQKVISLPAFDEGSVVEVHYIIRTKKDFPVPFGGMEVLVGEQPARKVYFAVASDVGNVNYKSISGAPKPKLSGGVVSWTITDYPGAEMEYQMPPLREIFPTVLYSASRSWTDEAEFVAGMFFQSTIPDSAVSAVAESLSAGKDKKEAMGEILYYIQEKFNKVSLNPNEVGYRPSPADVVFKNGYGDSRDLAALLIAMLKVAGIETVPALIASSGAKIVDFPTVHQFSKVVVKAKVDGKWIFLDPMSEYATPGHIGAAQGEKAFVIAPGRESLVPVPPFGPDDNKVLFNYALSFDASGNLSGKVITTAFGDLAGSLRAMFRHAKRSKTKQKIERAVSNVSDGAKLDGDFAIEGMDRNTGEAKIEIPFRAENYLVTQGDMAILWLPHSPFQIFHIPDVSADKRKFPIFVGITQTFEKNYSIEIPTGYRIAYVPPTINLKNNVGELHLSSQYGDNTCQISIRLTYKTKRISPKDYEKLKNLVKTISSKKYRLILLEKI